MGGFLLYASQYILDMGEVPAVLCRVRPCSVFWEAEGLFVVKVMLTHTHTHTHTHTSDMH